MEPGDRQRTGPTRFLMSVVGRDRAQCAVTTGCQRVYRGDARVRPKTAERRGVHLCKPSHTSAVASPRQPTDAWPLRGDSVSGHFSVCTRRNVGSFSRVLNLKPIFEQKSCYICTVQARHEQRFGDAQPDGRLQHSSWRLRNPSMMRGDLMECDENLMSFIQ